MNDRHGVPKKMRRVLKERGVETTGMTAEKLRATLASMEDFKLEKSLIEHFLIKRGHVPAFVPKFHPELNPIETVWAQLKRYTKAHCKYTIQSLIQYRSRRKGVCGEAKRLPVLVIGVIL